MTQRCLFQIWKLVYHFGLDVDEAYDFVLHESTATQLQAVNIVWQAYK